ncbi:MAG: DNA polymerase III subunit alpha, partial [Parcubacteria group bacterium Gr01-1014_72]
MKKVVLRNPLPAIILPMVPTPLHNHSHYSLLAALPKIPELVAGAKERGYSALALTDLGNLYGALEFYKECRSVGLRPIIGVDAFLAMRTRFDKEPRIDNKRSRIILLAKNLEGYKNLLRLVTAAHLEGFYYKPRMDRELLAEHHKGLIAILSFFTSDVSEALARADETRAEELLASYRAIFPEDALYLEVKRQHKELDETLVQASVALGRRTGTPLVAAHEVYYLKPEDKEAVETLRLINSAEAADRRREEDEADYSFLTPEALCERFADLPDALLNTKRIADACALELPLGKWVFPAYRAPEGRTHDQELRRIVYEGFARRNLKETPELQSRIEYELAVITQRGYAPYFLVVGDLLREAHERGILTTIRGSVAGSLVTYLAGITNVHPIEYKLPFERFLNPERPSPPDIDMDFADNRRDEMIEYTKQKYGEERVAQIGTFGTMMARGGVRDVARAQGFPYGVGDRIAKLIPFGAQGFPMTIDRALEEVADLKVLYKEDADARRIIDMAKKIEGCARHISVHAAGVVIAPESLAEFVPLQLDPKGGKIITQYDMHAVEDAGLLKMDFLGIRNLAILADAVALAEKLEKKKVDIENVPLTDGKTFELLAKGETAGLFQLNGSGMTRYLKDLRPTD